MNRPRQHIDKIITSIINSVNIPSVICSYHSTQPNDLLLQGDDIFIILEGWIELFHKDSKILLGRMNGPYILKLVPYNFSENYTVNTNSHFSYFTCSRSLFYAHIERQNLWRDLFAVLTYTNMLLFEQFEVMKMNNLYEVVKYYLIKIENDEAVMRKENVCLYITSRTGYSRSGVMTIIRALHKGGYIRIDKGKLVGIKNLPQGF